MKSDLYKLSASDIVKNIRTKKISAKDVALSCLGRIKKLEKQVKAWTFIEDALFLKYARNVDKKIKCSFDIGQLAGVPVGIKDIFNTYDMPTCMGSPLWKGFTPGNDARVVFRLRYEDSVIAGKTVTAEFAVHEPGPARNPHNIDYYPGTSSSGSAVAVSCGMVPLALGTQTAGSIIRPASYCGVYGFKPSFGLIPRTGVLKTNDTLDQIGWFARDIEDIAMLFEVLRVRGDDHPYTYKNLDKRSAASFLRNKWKVILVEHPKWNEADSYAKKDFEEFGRALSKIKGVAVERKKLPVEFHGAHEVHDKIYNKTLSYYFAEEYKKKHLVSKVLRKLMEEGKSITTKEYKDALKEQVRLRHRLEKFFSASDIILTLSTSGEAPRFSAAVDKPDSCLIWNLCGVPAINIPLFTGPHGLPFGLQAVANRYRDLLLFNFVRLLRKEGLAPKARISEPGSKEK